MLIRKKPIVFACVAVVLLASGGGFAWADDVAEGRTIYLRNCASCHGTNAEGNGPVAQALKTPPTNLRLLSDLYGKPL